MRTRHADQGVTRLQVGVALALALILFFLVTFLLRHEDANWFQSAFERSVKKLQLMEIMSRDLLASAEAEKSTVMADTDEASQAFAEQSMQASQRVKWQHVIITPNRRFHLNITGPGPRKWLIRNLYKMLW